MITASRLACVGHTHRLAGIEIYSDPMEITAGILFECCIEPSSLIDSQATKSAQTAWSGNETRR